MSLLSSLQALCGRSCELLIALKSQMHSFVVYEINKLNVFQNNIPVFWNTSWFSYNMQLAYRQHNLFYGEYISRTTGFWVVRNAVFPFSIV